MESGNDIVFIGSSGLGLQKLVENKYFSVIGVLCLEKRVNNDLSTVTSEHGFAIRTFKWIIDFRKLIECYPVKTPFFIYQLDMLVPADLTNKYCFYNVHRGNLFTNRGPNPDIWPILKGDTETALSLHKINEKIDSGILIDSYDVSIGPLDDTLDVKKKLEKGLPQLIQSLADFIKGRKKGLTLTAGIYRPWITELDITINLENDNLEVMGRKIRSQRPYDGAILVVDNKRYYVTDILKTDDQGDFGIKALDNGETIVAQAGSKVITFKINPIPKFPPLPKFPPSKRI